MSWCSPGMWRDIWQSKLSRLVTLVWAGFCYLIEPDAAFVAVMILVVFDLLSKFVAISVQQGGFIAAVLNGSLTSRKAFLGIFVKLVSYFMLGTLTVQVRYVGWGEGAVALSKTFVYSFLFMVEAISILENLIQAGCLSLKPLLKRLQERIRDNNN